MNDIKRYTPSYDNQMIIEDVGQWVTFEDYEKRVNGQLRLLEVSGRYNEKLEKRIAELEAQDVITGEYIVKLTDCNREYAERIDTLESSLRTILDIASYPPIDRAISEIAAEALGHPSLEGAE